MDEFDAELRARLLRAIAATEAASRRARRDRIDDRSKMRPIEVASVALARRTLRHRVDDRWKMRPAVTLMVALLAAAIIIGSVLVVAPRIHPTGTAVTPPSPAPTTAPVPPTLLPTTAPVPTSSATPSPSAPPSSPPSPMPTALPWSMPPQTIHEPQLIWEYTYQQQGNNVAPTDWTGVTHGGLRIPAAICMGNCWSEPAAQPPDAITVAPDGSRAILNGTTIIGLDGKTLGTLPGAPQVFWDGDNLHLCRLDGAHAATLSWVSPGTSRPVTALPAKATEGWRVIACSSARNRIVVVRYTGPSSDGNFTDTDLRTIELSTGRIVVDHAIGYTSGVLPPASGDARFVALNQDIYSTETGELVHTTALGAVQMFSWDGNRALVATQCCSQFAVIDWQNDRTIANRNNSISLIWRREGDDDLAFEYSVGGGALAVDMVSADGTTSTHSVSSS